MIYLYFGCCYCFEPTKTNMYTDFVYFRDIERGLPYVCKLSVRFWNYFLSGAL